MITDFNFLDFAEHLLSTPASGDVGAMQHLATTFRKEYCEKLFTRATGYLKTAEEKYKADPGGCGGGEMHIEALHAKLYLMLVFGHKRGCLKTLKELKEFIAGCIDEMVMERKAPEVIFDNPERNLTGEGATISVCGDLKDIVETAQKSVKLAFRLDMALKKLGKSFWKEEYQPQLVDTL